MYVNSHSDMHSRGISVIGALRLVDVVVGMDRRFGAQFAAQDLDGPISNNFVGVHVALGAGASLPDH